ncbi:MAG: hypothetical protein MR529_09395 [Cuneatibacter sp.]|nr:hypothetical protein [Cuneatibacter sp.]
MFSELTKREVFKSGQTATLDIGMTPSTVSLMSNHLLRFSKNAGRLYDVYLSCEDNRTAVTMAEKAWASPSFPPLCSNIPAARKPAPSPMQT